MDYFAKLIYRVEGVVKAIGASVLVGIAVLLASNIVYRLFGHVIAGTYELVGFFMVVTVAFALGYTALEKGHVAVTVLVARFSQRVRAIVESLTSVISIGMWGLILWGSITVLSERWLGDQTHLLEIPLLPLRFVWVLGLLILCLVLLFHLFNLLSRGRGK
jgi:TRAP-type C4-dicarboxylate transport system permease small subunit